VRATRPRHQCMLAIGHWLGRTTISISTVTSPDLVQTSTIFHRRLDGLDFVCCAHLDSTCVVSQHALLQGTEHDVGAGLLQTSGALISIADKSGDIEASEVVPFLRPNSTSLFSISDVPICRGDMQPRFPFDIRPTARTNLRD
jgi:hypothetical protein